MSQADPAGTAASRRRDVGPLIIAHRGSSAAVAEHTLGAYRRALAEGVDGLECDVRLTSDGELVCLHDRTLERTGLATGIVSTKTLAELRAVDWGAWKHGDDLERDADSGRLVTLRELIELALGAQRPIGLLIETKHPTRYGGRVEHEVAAVLREYGLDGAGREQGVWARMMSFSHLAVRRMLSLCPELGTVYLMSQPIRPPYRGGSLPVGVATAGLDIAILRERPEVVAGQQARGHEVFVWTVDREDDIGLCLDLGVDGIISNRPADVLDAARRRR